VTAAGRAAAIENGLERFQAQVAATARDPGVATALGLLEGGFEQLRADPLLTPEQDAAVDSFYEEGLAAFFGEAGIDPPPIEDLVPESEVGRYLQYRWIVENPFPTQERAELDSVDDGTAYDAAHAATHPFLRELSDTLIGDLDSDLLLVSAATSDIVYSVDKRSDFATNLATGPYSDTALAEAVLERLSEAGVGEAVFVDYEPYLPAGGSPSLFLASAITADRELIGALVLEIPSEALTDTMTAGGRFEELGLGQTGEAYVVGGDRLMRSDPRFFIEDPEGYLERFRAEGYAEESAELIEFSESTAFLQPVDTEPAEAALDGEDFSGVTDNYLGFETLSSAVPVGAGDLDWVVVAEIRTEETDNALNEYLERILLIAAVLTPIVDVVAFLLSRGLTRS
ncbi:MAG: hypothetical protein AAGK32_12795, partial [Actinomycetota bacterium]